MAFRPEAFCADLATGALAPQSLSKAMAEPEFKVGAKGKKNVVARLPKSSRTCEPWFSLLARANCTPKSHAQEEIALP